MDKKIAQSCMPRIAPLFLLVFLFLNGCTKESSSPTHNSYYPLETNSWVYQRQFFNNGSTIYAVDTLQFFTGTDTLAYDATYRKIMLNNRTSKLIRIDGSKYYE